MITGFQSCTSREVSMPSPISLSRILLILLLAWPGTALAQKPTAVPHDDNPALRPFEHVLRRMELRENDIPVELGARLVAEHPDDPALLGVYAIALGGYSGSDEALELVESGLVRWPREPWLHAARGFLLSDRADRATDALAAAARVRELAPNDPALAFRAMQILQARNRHTEAIAVADTLIAAGLATPRLHTARAATMIALANAGETRDTALFRSAFDALAAARAQWPDVAETNFVEGNQLRTERRIAEALPLLRRAVELAPMSNGLRRAWWNALNAQTTVTAEEKRAAIRRDMDEYLELRGHALGALFAVAQHTYEMRDSDRAAVFQERLLREYPDSWQATRIMLQRAWSMAGAEDRLATTAADSLAARQRYRQRLWEVADRPVANRATRSDVYLSLFTSMRHDSTVNGEELWVLHQRMQPHVRNARVHHALIPAALAERGVRLAEAQQLARAGRDIMEDELELERPRLTVAEYANRFDWVRYDSHSTLGWILFHTGRPEEAVRELVQAYEIRPDFSEAPHRLGRIAEAAGDLETAERWYSAGRVAELGDPESSHAALVRIFTARRGSSEGFDRYVAEIDERERIRRREKIIASRIAEPRTMPAFELEWLNGGRFSSEALEGRVAVINFWGVWCGPCVREAPEIQKVAEKYRSHADVVFITISNDGDPDTTREWMRQQGYDFPTLIEEGVAGMASVRGYPTTFFLDRSGLIVFEAQFSNSLVEEFTWRVEELLGGR
jgi:thiol-disulfide isomerase/thioredoxin/tetratricopeptide (TPR) repeat protein